MATFDDSVRDTASPQRSRRETVGAPAPVLALQRAIGNRAVTRVLGRPVVVQRVDDPEGKIFAELWNANSQLLKGRDKRDGKRDLPGIIAAAKDLAEARAKWDAYLFATLKDDPEYQRKWRNHLERRDRLEKETQERQREFDDNKRKREEEEQKRGKAEDVARPKKRRRVEGGPERPLSDRRDAAFYGERIETRGAGLSELSRTAHRRVQQAEGLVDQDGAITAKGYALLKRARTEKGGDWFSTAEFYFLLDHHDAKGQPGTFTLAKDQDGAGLVTMGLTGSASLKGPMLHQVGKYTDEPRWRPAGANTLDSASQAVLARIGDPGVLADRAAELFPDLNEQQRAQLSKRSAARRYWNKLEQGRNPATAVVGALAMLGAQLGFWSIEQYYREYEPMRGSGATTNTRADAAPADAGSVQRSAAATLRAFITECLKPANHAAVQGNAQLRRFLPELLDYLERDTAGTEGEQERFTQYASELLRSPERKSDLESEAEPARPGGDEHPAASPPPPVARPYPTFIIPGFTPADLLPDEVIRTGVRPNDIILINGVAHTVFDTHGTREPSNDNPFGLALGARIKIRGG